MIVCSRDLPVTHCAERPWLRQVAARVSIAAALLLLPAIAQAQATLAGTVRDASGAVLPGVGVDASGSALIEKTRSAVTDATGQYRITELPPGDYVRERRRIAGTRLRRSR
jgi:hypothetical protein